MVNPGCIPYEVDFATAVIRAPYEFNRICVESLPLSHEQLIKRVRQGPFY
jgi:hypothetical protein